MMLPLKQGDSTLRFLPVYKAWFFEKIRETPSTMSWIWLEQDFGLEPPSLTAIEIRMRSNGEGLWK
jgi:hypothetical protein